jgi:hypothetical protein
MPRYFSSHFVSTRPFRTCRMLALLCAKSFDARLRGALIQLVMFGLFHIACSLAPLILWAAGLDALTRCCPSAEASQALSLRPWRRHSRPLLWAALQVSFDAGLKLTTFPLRPQAFQFLPERFVLVELFHLADTPVSLQDEVSSFMTYLCQYATTKQHRET